MTVEGIGAALARVREASPRVVCLPDLFLDHFVRVPSWADADERVREAVARGGGNLLDTPQAVHPGGNAANTAWALARLGADVRLAGVTSPRLLPLFEAELGGDGVDLSLVDEVDRGSLTTVLSVGDPPANAMMNEPGALADLAPGDLGHGPRRAVRDADAVLVANWASMREAGTRVVADVLELARRSGTASYLDAADPSDRSPGDRSGLVDALSATPPDVWAMNEHEARVFAGVDDPGDADRAGRRLADRTGASVDVHAHDAAASFVGDERVETSAFEVREVHRTTGAGDAFNAGNLLGHLLDLEPAERLVLAHAVAGCYVSREVRRPPTVEDVAAFAERSKAYSP